MIIEASWYLADSLPSIFRHTRLVTVEPYETTEKVFINPLDPPLLGDL